MLKVGITKKLVILIVVALLVTSAAIIIVNRILYQRDMRQQLETVQLPLNADKILAAIDRVILEPSRGLAPVINNPYFLDWIKAGEPEAGQDNVYKLMGTINAAYGTTTANYASRATNRYFKVAGSSREVL